MSGNNLCWICPCLSCTLRRKTWYECEKNFQYMKFGHSFPWKLHFDYLDISHLIWVGTPVLPWILSWKYEIKCNHWDRQLQPLLNFSCSISASMICSGLDLTQEKFNLHYDSSYLGGIRVMHLYKSTYHVITLHQLPSHSQWYSLETLTVYWVYFFLVTLVIWLCLFCCP